MSTIVPEPGQRERMENIWIRCLYMVLYFLVHRLAAWLLYFVVAIQFLVVLFSKEKNKTLVDFGWSLNQYILQAGQFLTFETDSKPFPFKDWPVRKEMEETVSSDQTTSEKSEEETE